MPDLSGIADPKYVSGQYRSAAHLNTRIGLHERFSVNPYGWQRWVFDQFDLPAQCSILELGCGAGHLWTTNLDRLPPGWTVCLSDASAGMLAQARANLGESAARSSFRQVDARAIPFADGSFDAVIANHMLYHVPDRAKALAEIRRVLKPGGRLYTSTVGAGHLRELRAMLVRFSPVLADWGVSAANSFMLEDGAEQLRRWFPHVSVKRYEDALLVTEVEPLIEYILSGRIAFSPQEKQDLTCFVGQEMARQGGKIHITKEGGLFIAGQNLA
jgi:ubiquinone/menaquinone biosynthesis C-methylase UbiE